MPTTPGGIPYPADSDVPDVPYWMQQQAEAVDQFIGDTGWVDGTVTIAATTGSYIRARRVGEQVEVIVNISGGATIPTGNSAIGNLPAGMAPSVTSRRLPAYLNAMTCMFYVSTGGEVGVTNDSGAARSSALGGGTYFQG